MKVISDILKNKILPFLKKHIFYVILLGIIGILALRLNYVSNKENSLLQQPTVVENGENGTYREIYYSEDNIKALKKENKELYDSLKAFKDKINFVAQFDYSKTYEMDTVYIDTISKHNIYTYEYANSLNDSINYNLKIGSETMPAWYLLKVSVADKFTIVNKTENSLNETSVESLNKGQISDVTLFNKTANKTSFWKRFSLGPAVTAGYCLRNKNADIMVGVSLTYNLLK